MAAKGGLNAENYISSGAARATATRDFQDVVDKGVLILEQHQAGDCVAQSDLSTPSNAIPYPGKTETGYPLAP